MSNISIRNIAIIAHVDHGKTTLVDALLRQSKTKLGKGVVEQNLIMDSHELEKERGITIFSKNAAVYYKGTKINIIDTPGHADFGGEVERVLHMADGCLLLVNAKEGPMPQTRFVLKKALQMGHIIIVVINKIDKGDARPDFVLDKTFDLFVELGADDKRLDFPVLYTCAKDGKAGFENNLSNMQDITPVFEAILNHIPAPSSLSSIPLQMLVANISYDTYKGRIGTGRIYQGTLRANQEIAHINRAGVIKNYRITSLMTFHGLDRVEVEEVQAGDIVSLAGIPDITIGETIADPQDPKALPLLSIEEPTVKITLKINDSPFAGKEGKFTTSRQIKERLLKELETDMALLVEDSNEGSWILSGRGELHLSVLIERMRREGYEFQISMPQVIVKEIEGQLMVPYELVFIEVPEAHQGIVIQTLGKRRGELRSMKIEQGIAHMEFIIPTRGLFGYRNQFLTDTRGYGIINTSFYGYLPDPSPWQGREKGSLVAYSSGTTTMYGLLQAQGRGTLFVSHGVPVYKGQVVGQNARSQDIAVNVCKIKQLSNMRSKGEGTSDHFNTPRIMELEDALNYIGEDELVEVTPANVRIRKM